MTAPSPVTVTLPATQYAVARELARDGADNATIAARLHFAPSSVASYMNRALAATGCPNRTALAVGLLRGRLRIATADGRARA